MEPRKPREEECQNQVTLTLCTQVQEHAMGLSVCTPPGSWGGGMPGPTRGKRARLSGVRGQERSGEEWMTSTICYANQWNSWGQGLRHILSSLVPAPTVLWPREVGWQRDFLHTDQAGCHFHLPTTGVSILSCPSLTLLRSSLMACLPPGMLPACVSPLFSQRTLQAAASWGYRC